MNDLKEIFNDMGQYFKAFVLLLGANFVAAAIYISLGIGFVGIKIGGVSSEAVAENIGVLNALLLTSVFAMAIVQFFFYWMYDVTIVKREEQLREQQEAQAAPQEAIASAR